MAWKNKRKLIFIILWALVLILVLSFVWRLIFKGPGKAELVMVKGREMRLETVSDAAGMYRGLSGRQSLCLDCGLIFNFPGSAPRHFTMRGMMFPLDIVFLNQGRVAAILQNLPPDPPGQASDYPGPDSDQVLEINAGRAESLGLEVGDVLELPR